MIKFEIDQKIENIIIRALRDGNSLHGFRSGGGLRVLTLSKGKVKTAYGESPNLNDAFRILSEDYTQGGRQYHNVYGNVETHYLTGSLLCESEFEKIIFSGGSFDAYEKNNQIVCNINTYSKDYNPITKTGQRAFFVNAVVDAMNKLNDNRKKTAKEAVLELINETPRRAADVRSKLTNQGYKSSELRKAIGELWDEGSLNVSLDQTLLPVGKL